MFRLSSKDGGGVGVREVVWVVGGCVVGAGVWVGVGEVRAGVGISVGGC